ncbi:MAG: MurT ligase domain-containing protein [Patescibacteria group bacterium]|nr:MurT ligase domain-containing protein [Patescibacteria group bacterium]
MDLRFGLSKLFGKTIFFFLRVLGKGATALPGLWAIKIDPNFVYKSAKNQNCIVITGTNGKTTTAHALAKILKDANQTITHNLSGSNLLRGVATTFLINKPTDWAIIETDEAAFSTIVPQVQPKLIIILNLFRDQMDRYGEIDKTAKLWQKTLSNLNFKSTVLLNADDPMLGYIGQKKSITSQHKIIFFGLSDFKIGGKISEHAADSLLSPTNNKKLKYKHFFFSHLGIYHEPESNFHHPKLDFKIENIKLKSFQGSEFKIIDTEVIDLKTNLPGVFNIYNLSTAVIAAKILNIEDTIIKKSIADFKPAFGRAETIKIADKKITFLLIKNPVGFNQIISLLQDDIEHKDLLIGINDQIADGTDVSWLWDADIERLTLIADHFTTTGTRAHEMALRLKYAGFRSDEITIVNNPKDALDNFIKNSQKENLYCLLTYTTMIELRQKLVKLKLVKPFYE